MPANSPNIVFNNDKPVKRSSLDKKKDLSSISFFLKIVLIVFVFLLIVNYSRKLYSGTPVTFSGFLDWLSNLNSFRFNINISDFFISSDWGLFNGLRNFLNIFTGAFGVISFMSANFMNLLIFVAQFIAFIFV